MLHRVLAFVAGQKCTILDLEEALEHLAATRKSLIRWGDGETEIVRGRGIYYQSADEKLVGYLQRILRQDHAKILIGVPAEPLKVPLVEMLIKRRLWLFTRYVWAQNAKPDAIYADAFIFRRDPAAAMAALRSFAKRRSHLIVVSPNPEDLDFFAGVGIANRWISVPPENAFATIDQTIDKILEASLELSDGADAANGLVLMAAGPAAKAFAYELSDRIQCFDVGSLFEFQRKPAKRVWPG